MKKILFFSVFILFFSTDFTFAQIADGNTVPDFTFTDINGNTQNLYTYLNAGKFVAIDVSTTWCNPCWVYHRSGVMDSLYSLHDTIGDNTWRILFIEGDATTTINDLNGTGTNTQGNWLSGTLFPIMNPTGISLNDFLSSFNITIFPTLFLICPNKKIYADTLNKGLKPKVNEWEYVARTNCGWTGLDEIKDNNPVTIYPNPASDYTIIYFSLNNATEVKLSISTTLGNQLEEQKLGILNPGSHSIKYDLSGLNKGIYFFTISDGNGRYVIKKLILN